MGCKATKRALAHAEHDRDDAQLHEVMEWERARYDAQHFHHAVYDWADLRKATKDVRCWEARCNGAEVALAKCKEGEANSRRTAKKWPLINALTE